MHAVSVRRICVVATQFLQTFSRLSPTYEILITIVSIVQRLITTLKQMIKVIGMSQETRLIGKIDQKENLAALFLPIEGKITFVTGTIFSKIGEGGQLFTWCLPS